MTREFFEQHTVTELMRQSDYWLECRDGYALVYWPLRLYLQLVRQQAQIYNIILLPVTLILNGIVTGMFGTPIGKLVIAVCFNYLISRRGLIGQIARALKVGSNT